MSLLTPKVSLYLKQVTFSEQEGSYQRLFEMVFPGFWDELGHAKEAQFRTRRYSGDLQGISLDRGQYYTICSNNSGDDRGCLANELGAYRASSENSKPVIVDCAVEHHLSSISDIPIMCAPQTFWLFIEDPDFEWMSAIAGADGAYAVFPPYIAILASYSVNLVELKNVFDLRLPNTQKWIIRTLNKCGATLNTHDHRTAWADLLAALYNTNLGGRFTTDFIGALARNMGAEGLIYPSARCNSFVKIENGLVVDWYGFNFVDYRKARRISQDVTYKFRADEFNKPWDQLLVEYLADPTLDGSWRINGIEQSHKQYFESGRHLGTQSGNYGEKEYAVPENRFNIGEVLANVQIPIDAGQGFRFEAGRHSDLMSDTIPI